MVRSTWFACDLCTRKVTANEREQLDLSSWRGASISFEPSRGQPRGASRQAHDASRTRPVPGCLKPAFDCGSSAAVPEQLSTLPGLYVRRARRAAALVAGLPSTIASGRETRELIVGHSGLEPEANGLRIHCSTN